MSPMSDSTNIASAMTGATLFEHIGAMMYTTIPASLICLGLYTGLGIHYAGAVSDMSNVQIMLETLDATFNISLIAILPAILMLVVSAKKVPAILGLGGCALFSVLFAMFMQPITFQAANYGGGFFWMVIISDTGVAMADANSEAAVD